MELKFELDCFCDSCETIFWYSTILLAYQCYPEIIHWLFAQEFAILRLLLCIRLS